MVSLSILCFFLLSQLGGPLGQSLKTNSYYLVDKEYTTSLIPLQRIVFSFPTKGTHKIIKLIFHFSIKNTNWLSKLQLQYKTISQGVRKVHSKFKQATTGIFVPWTYYKEIKRSWQQSWILYKLENIEKYGKRKLPMRVVLFVI